MRNQTHVNHDKVTVAGEDYTTLRLLGNGGYSSVYEVYSSQNQIYALKVVDLDAAK
jgi:serine/threonine protein kinase